MEVKFFSWGWLTNQTLMTNANRLHWKSWILWQRKVVWSVTTIRIFLRVTTHAGRKYQSVQLDEKALKEADVVVLTTNHSAFDVEFIQQHARLIVDLRNMIQGKSEKLFKL